MFTEAIISVLLMENGNDKTIITDQFILVYRDSKLILHVVFFHVFFFIPEGTFNIKLLRMREHC
jgi:hypothetical protein